MKTNTLKQLLALGAATLCSLPQAYAVPVDVTWNGGTGNFNDGTQWDTTTVPGSDDTAKIDGGNATVSDVTLTVTDTVGRLEVSAGDSLSLNNSIDLTINGVAGVGGIANDGTISMNATAGTADTNLTFTTSQTLSGSGSIEMSNDIDNRILMSGGLGQILTQSAGHTIRGSGELLANTGGMVNNGVIEQTGSVGMVIDPAFGNSFVNNGTLSATGTGGIRFTGGLFNLSTGGASVSDTSRLTVATAATVIGGTITTAGTGFVEVQSGSIFDGVTLAAGSNASHANGHDTTIRSGLVNNGTWSLNATGGSTADTDLTFNLSQTLSGTGTVEMSNDNDNRILLTGGTDQTLTQSAGHTIRGSGDLLANTGGMINNGVIEQTGGIRMTIDPSAGNSFVNNGTLSATGTGGIVFGPGLFDLSVGGVSVSDMSRLRVTSGATVDGGTIATAGTGFVKVESGSIFDGVTLAAGSNASHANGHDTTIRNGLVNNGTWSLNAGAGTADTDIVFNLSQTLSGTGTVEMGNDNDNRIHLTGGADQTLTQSAGHTIRGSGDLLANTGGLINNGVIEQTGSVRMNIDPSFGNSFVNNGTLSATGTGGIVFNAGAFDLSVGGVSVSDMSSLTVTSGATVDGGTIATAGTGFVKVESGSIFDGVTLAAGSNASHANGHDTTIRNGLVNNGTWSLNAGAGTADTDIVFNLSQTLSGTGTVEMGNDVDNRIHLTGGADQTLTQSAGHTIRGSGDLLANTGGLINNGVIEQTGSVRMNIDPSAGSNFVNNGTLSATGAGGIVFNAGVFDLSVGGVSVSAGSSLTVFSGATVDGGTIATAGTGFVEVESGSIFDGVTLAAGSNASQANGHDTTIRNGLVNNGTWSLNAGIGTANTDLVFNLSQTLSGTGTVEMSNDVDNRIHLTGGSAQVLTQSAGHTIRGSGDLLANTGGMINNGVIEQTGNVGMVIDPSIAGFKNRGTLHATGLGGITMNGTEFSFETAGNNVIVDAGSKMVKNTGSYDQSGGSTLVNGMLDINGNVMNLTGGILAGSGTVNGTVNNSGGSVGPGNSPGLLSIIGDYVEATTASLIIELGGLNAGTEYDVLSVGGNATLAGLLDIQFIGSFINTVANGDVFTFLTATNLTGVFANSSVNAVNGLAIGATGLFFNLEYGSDFARLVVDGTRIPPIPGVPDASNTAFLLLVAFAGLVGFRRVRASR